MTSAVVDSGGSGLEFDSTGVQIQDEENDPVSEYPAVIVEPVPSARVEQGYAAQIFVYDDETYLLQDVAEEQEIETETVKTEILSVAQGKPFNFFKKCYREVEDMKTYMKNMELNRRYFIITSW